MIYILSQDSLFKQKTVNPKEPAKDLLHKKISDSNNKNDILTMSTVTSANFYLPGINITGSIKAHSDTMTRMFDKYSSVETNSNGNVYVRDNTVLFIYSEKGSVTPKGSRQVWTSMGKETIAMKDKTGKETEGFYTKAIESVFETSHKPQLTWDANSVESMNFKDFAAVWKNHNTGGLTPHDKSGSWRSITTGSFIPEFGSSDQDGIPMDLHLFQALTNFTSVPLDATFESYKPANWTSCANGNYSSDDGKTYSWYMHMKNSIYIDGATKTWTMSANGTTEISQNPFDLLFGTEEDSHSGKHPYIIFFLWFNPDFLPKNFHPLKQHQHISASKENIASNEAFQCPQDT